MLSSTLVGALLLVCQPAGDGGECIACDVDAGRVLERYSDEQREALRAGEVLALPGARGDLSARAALTLDAPPAVVWKVLTTYGRWPEFQPRLEELSVLPSAERGEVRLRHRVEILGLDVRYGTLRRLHPRQGRIEVRLDPGQDNDLEASRTRWQLVPLDGGRRTLVEVRLELRTGWWIPGAIERGLIRRTLPERLEALREEVLRRERAARAAE